MNRIVLTTAVIVAASLVAAPSAEAKGYVRAIQVCGPSGCAKAHGSPVAMGRLGLDMLAGTGVRDAPAAASALLRAPVPAALRVSRLGHVLHPGAKVDLHGQRMHPGTTRPRADPVAAAASVGSFAPRVSSVTIGDRPRADRAGFATLFNQRPAALPSTSVWKSRHYSIIVKFSEITPWSLGGVQLDGLLPALPRPEPRRALVSRRRRRRPARARADRPRRRRGRPPGGRSRRRPSSCWRPRRAPDGGCGGRGPADPWRETTRPGSAATKVTSMPCFGPTTPRSCAIWPCASARRTTRPTSLRRCSWQPGAACPGFATAAARCWRGSTGWRRTWRVTG